MIQTFHKSRQLFSIQLKQSSAETFLLHRRRTIKLGVIFCNLRGCFCRQKVFLILCETPPNELSQVVRWANLPEGNFVRDCRFREKAIPLSFEFSSFEELLINLKLQPWHKFSLGKSVWFASSLCHYLYKLIFMYAILLHRRCLLGFISHSLCINW